ncbi:MAG: Holliday junction branch migration protein RuvA [Patescibacteria group bacterium]
MIASLAGTISYKTSELRKDAYFIVDVSGVGYKVYSPASNLKKVKEGEKITVYTYLAVSENAMDLYGFLNPADKTFFTLLLDVPQIGPKSAMAILEKTTMAEVQQAILENNPTLLTKMSGLTSKTAEKIVLGLKDKVQSLTVRPKIAGEKNEVSLDTDIFDALVGFGYSAAEAKQVISQIDKKSNDASTCIREALKILGKK